MGEVESYRYLIDGCWLAVGGLVGAAAGLSLVYPLLDMFVTADRPTVVPTYELAVTIGVAAGAILGKVAIRAWRIAAPTTTR